MTEMTEPFVSPILVPSSSRISWVSLKFDTQIRGRDTLVFDTCPYGIFKSQLRSLEKISSRSLPVLQISSSIHRRVVSCVKRESACQCGQVPHRAKRTGKGGAEVHKHGVAPFGRGLSARGGSPRRPGSCPYSPKCLERLSEKSLGGLWSVGVGVTRLQRQVFCAPFQQFVRSAVRAAKSFGTVSKPILLSVGSPTDDHKVVSQELKKRYGDDYNIKTERSAKAGLEVLHEHGDNVALVLVDKEMPETTGIDLLVRAQHETPHAKRALLIAWEDQTSEPILDSVALGYIDHLIIKPLQHPDEQFHRAIVEMLAEWTRDHRPGPAAIHLIAKQLSRRSHELRELLTGNMVPFAFHSEASQEGKELLTRVGRTSMDLPIIIMPDGKALVKPDDGEIAEALGVNVLTDQQSFDIIVVGAGPAGLAAAVNSASEGLRTLVIEKLSVGGQAGTSSLIRNYLGFSRGINGRELATQAYRQAAQFGTTFHLMGPATTLRRRERSLLLTVPTRANKTLEIVGKAVIIATGITYNRLAIPPLEALSGVGVFYGTALTEAQAITGQTVYVVGGGNSAGQAAMHLSRYASHVKLLHYKNSLDKMSEYLIKQIKATQKIEICLNTEVVEGGGKDRLEHLRLMNNDSGDIEDILASALFLLIGGKAHTDWLPDEIECRDGYIVTGRQLLNEGRTPWGWFLKRAPLPLETSMPGVFAIGDVRYGSAGRVASAVGEGSVVIKLVHEYLDHEPVDWEETHSVIARLGKLIEKQSGT
jgi:thioredoxin reductase (NADPH)